MKSVVVLKLTCMLAHSTSEYVQNDDIYDS